jgi:hypothetical protein
MTKNADNTMEEKTDRQTNDCAKSVRNTEKPIQKCRLTVQIAFALLCVWIGIEFHFFVRFLDSGGTTTFVSRPPGVEGFLPISSLMSLYYFFLTGEIHAAHPAGLFILAAFLIMSLVFGKVFCSWLCPIGFVSEVLGDLGDRIFNRRLRLPAVLDWTLRMIKYLLLGFFIRTGDKNVSRQSLQPDRRYQDVLLLRRDHSICVGGNRRARAAVAIDSRFLVSLSLSVRRALGDSVAAESAENQT